MCLGLTQAQFAAGLASRKPPCAAGSTATQSRVQHALSQTELAKRMKSSPSRIAKIEATDPSVSIDLMGRELLDGGARRADVARALRYSISNSFVK
jgi:ABC-type transport system involved in cytochrome bd biosynthesis fused ATPase/permease subunit